MSKTKKNTKSGESDHFRGEKKNKSQEPWSENNNEFDFYEQQNEFEYRDFSFDEESNSSDW